MQHVVFWTEVSGPAFERVPDLAAAIELVQWLRNDHDVIDAEVHALTSVPLSFRTVVVVEPSLGTELAPAPVTEPSLPAFASPISPFGSDVPGVVPDSPNDSGPHLVGLPSVSAEQEREPEQEPGYESAPDGPARSLGLFA